VKTCKAALITIGSVVVLVTFTPFTTWYARKLARPWTDARGEVLVVLGGATEGDAMGHSSYLRARYAARAFKEGGFQKVVICGGGEPVALSTMIGDFLESQGVPKDAIVVEITSRSTRENAANAKPILAAYHGRKILLTSDYHNFRAVRCFRKAGADVTGRPIPDAIKHSTGMLGRWPAFLDEATETVKIGYYYARGWI